MLQVAPAQCPSHEHVAAGPAGFVEDVARVVGFAVDGLELVPVADAVLGADDFEGLVAPPNLLTSLSPMVESELSKSANLVAFLLAVSFQAFLTT